MSNLSGILPELQMGLSSLFVHKLRSLLTMLGMIFGVGAVVAMLSITAGAQKEMMSYIDLLGVNNIIIEAKEAVDRNELQTRRAISQPARWAETTSPVTRPAIPSRELGIAFTRKSTPARRAASSDSSRASVSTTA